MDSSPGPRSRRWERDKPAAECQSGCTLTTAGSALRREQRQCQRSRRGSLQRCSLPIARRSRRRGLLRGREWERSSDAYTGDPVDFKFINGNLVRTLGRVCRCTLRRVADQGVRIQVGIARLELKLDVFNVFNHPLFILNNGNDALSGIINLPNIGAGFNCTANCINPYTKLYLGANGQALNISDFRSGRVDKDFNGTLKFGGLGNPSGDVTPRIMQLAIRFRW